MLVETLVCDVKDVRPCKGKVMTFTLVVAGERQAKAVDLCELHASALNDVFAQGRVVDLPTRPRARMEPTKLKTTPRTAPLKKRGGHGEKAESARPDEDREA